MRDLTVRVPVDVQIELAIAVAALEAYGPIVCDALKALGRLATAAWEASDVPANLDPAEVAAASDAEWERVEARLGIAAGFDVALAIDKANPQSC